jgi:uncharacterized protein YggE
MKKLFAAVLALVLILALVGCSGTAPNEMAVRLEEGEDSITVSGNAGIQVKPDMAQVTVGVVASGSTSEAAREANAQAMADTQAALEALGIGEEDMMTSDITLRPTYVYTNNYSEGTINGYRMSTDLVVTVRDLEKVGEVLDAAIGAGSNSLDSLEFLVSNQDELYNEALADAVELARQKAELLAAAAGKTVGQALTITESSRAVATVKEYNTNPDTAGSAMADTARTIVQEGSTTITAQVEVVFAMGEAPAATA